MKQAHRQPDHSTEELHDPTPEEIREECRRIREEWDDATRRRRSGQPRPKWTVPQTDRVSA